GRARGDDLHHLGLDLGLQPVAPAVALGSPRGGVESAPDERLHRVDARLLGDPAHLADGAAQRVQLFIEWRDHMAGGHAWLSWPKRPLNWPVSGVAGVTL